MLHGGIDSACRVQHLDLTWRHAGILQAGCLFGLVKRLVTLGCGCQLRVQAWCGPGALPASAANSYAAVGRDCPRCHGVPPAGRYITPPDSCLYNRDLLQRQLGQHWGSQQVRAPAASSHRPDALTMASCASALQPAWTTACLFNADVHMLFEGEVLGAS